MDDTRMTDDIRTPNVSAVPDRLDAAIDAEVKRRSTGEPGAHFAARVAARARTPAGARRRPAYVLGALIAIGVLILAAVLPRHRDPAPVDTVSIITGRPPIAPDAPPPPPPPRGDVRPVAPKQVAVNDSPAGASPPRQPAARAVAAAALADAPADPLLERLVSPLDRIAPLVVQEVAPAPVVSEPLEIVPVIVEPIRISSIASGPF